MHLNRFINYNINTFFTLCIMYLCFFLYFLFLGVRFVVRLV
jgi:hypothetical protein